MSSLNERIAAHLARVTGGDVRVVAVHPLSGGACQENFSVEWTLDGAPQRHALRSDARTSLPGSIGRGAEVVVIEAARAAGTLTPTATWPVEGLVRPGAVACFLAWVEGEAIGARVTRHPSLAAARTVLPGQLATSLAAIHRVTPASHPDLPIARAPFMPEADPVEAALGFLAQLLDALPQRRPAGELVLKWLRDHRPASGPVTLVHGDFRTGNFMVGPEGLRGVLDWEFAHWGDPAEDLGWLCVRDWRFGLLDRPVGGLCDRATFGSAYAAAAGAPVDPARIHYWEVVGNLRWGTAAAYQGLRHAAEGDLELLAIPRRAAEMEYEALRLIEVGS